MKALLILLSFLYAQLAFSYTPNPCKAVQKNDKDGDGKVSESEWVAFKGSPKGFIYFDFDHDGYVTPSELAMKWQQQGKEFIARGCEINTTITKDIFLEIKDKDSNKDGILSLDEYQGNERLQKNYDLNGNGEISPWELGSIYNAYGIKIKTNDAKFDATLVTNNQYKNVKFLQTLPAGDGPYPIVILSSGGEGFPQTSWLEYLKDWGYAVISIDHKRTHQKSFGGGTHGQASYRQEDLPVIIEYIRSKPEIFSKEISIIGFSVGNAAVFIADRYEIKKGIAFYPYKAGCGTVISPPKKLLYIFGSLDPVYNSCWASSTGKDEVFVIPGAYHAFDGPYRKGITPHGRFTEIYEWNPEAFKKSRDKVKDFLTQ